MKRFLWILTIAASLITALLLLSSVLAANDAPRPLASPTGALAQRECDCSKLKALQVELRNALLLQQAMRKKIPELRTLDHTKSLTEYKRFTENDARRGLEPAPGYEKLSKADQAALSQYNFDVKGFALSDPTHPPKTEEWNEATLCSLTASAQLALSKVRSLAACPGISAAIQAHEDVHTRTCLRGFVAFFGMNGAERAQDEVEAYEAQISVLRAEIAKVLERAPCCDGQWYGTVTYTYIVSSKSNETISPANPRPAASSNGGTKSQDWTITQSGTVTVNGNEWIANASADEIYVMEESSSGKFVCSARGSGGKPPPLVGWSDKRSEVRYGGGSSQGKVTPGISLNRDDYLISIKPLTVNGTVQTNSQTSHSGGCPPAKPPNSFSNSSNRQYGLNDYIVGRANYAADRNILSGSDTKTRSTPSSSSPPAVPGLPTSTITGSITITTTITWNLRRCNR